MNWRKIKTILIVVLLMTNAFLGYTYVIEKVRFHADLKNNIEDMIQLYESKEIRINQEKLSFPRSIRSANITFETYDGTFVDRLLGISYEFDGEQYFNSTDILKLDENQIIIGKSAHFSRIQHDSPNNLKGFKRIDQPSTKGGYIEKSAMYFKNKNMSLNYDKVQIRQLGRYTIVQFYQYYETYLFDESKLLVWFYEDEIVGFSRKNIVNTSTTPGTKYDIITVDRVLYELLPDLDEGDEVTNIKIVYKLNDASLMVNNLVSGEALPYYQLKLADGQVFYVRAVNYFE